MSQFKAGDVVVSSQPFSFVVLASHRSQICNHCWRRLEICGQECCPSCGVVRFCGEDCRRRGEEEHNEECGSMKRERGFSDQLRLVVKIWRKIRKEGVHKSETHGEVARCCDDLMDHVEELVEDREDLLIAQYEQMEAVMPRSEIPPWKIFLSIYGKVMTNCFSLRSDRKTPGEPFGIGLYLLGSIFDHSCVPNCTVVFNGRELVIMATQDIDTGGIPNVAFISYVNTMDDTKTRQKQQQANWFFTCRCSLCRDTRFDSEKHSLKCAACSAVRPVDIVQWRVPKPCMTCSYINEKDDLEQLSKYREFFSLLTEMESTEIDDKVYNYLSAWCAGLMDEVFTDLDILYIRTCHYVHTICMEHCQWQAAILYGEIALPSFKTYYGEDSKVVAALLVRLGEACSATGCHTKAEDYLSTAGRIYRQVPGQDHPLYYKDWLSIAQEYIYVDAD